MALSGEEGLGGARSAGCGACGAQLAADQRYCLECGERRGPLPEAVASWLSIVPPEPARAPAAAVPVEVGDGGTPPTRYMPEPRSAAVAVMALLAFGVVLGAATGPAAQSAGFAPIVLYDHAEPAPAPVAEAEAEAEAVEPPPAPAAPAAEALPPETVLPEAPPVPAEKAPPEIPEAPPLPPIRHVFAIVLGDNGYERAFGAGSPAPYLAETLREKGELLENYYAVAQGDLANEIALLSGQGPNPATAADCPLYTDVAPGSLDAVGQAQGEGCVYPAEVRALPDLLAAAGRSWRAYVEDIGSGQAGEATSCRHPAAGAADDASEPRPGDAYQTWRNPFVYFHSILDGPECAEADVGLDRLATDLRQEAQTPAFSYIVPNACHDGAEEPCGEGQPAGLAAAQPFLETVVPEIEESDAYRKGGLIAITFAQAPQVGPEADASACCSTPEYPNLPPAASPAPATNSPVKSSGGGGRVGMLLLSPYVEPGSSNESGYYNHFSFLRSVEELLEVTPPLGYAAEPALTGFDSTVFNLGE